MTEKKRQEAERICQEIWDLAFERFHYNDQSGKPFTEALELLAAELKQVRNRTLEEAARKASQFSDYDLGATEDAIRALKKE